MTIQLICVFLTLGLLVAATILLTGDRLRRVSLWFHGLRGDTGKTAKGNGTLHEDVQNVLTSLNCKQQWNKNHVAYDYQNGHFSLTLDEESASVNLAYPTIFTTSVDHINLIRSLCNHWNINSEQIKLVYTIDSYNIAVHILSTIRVNRDMLAVELQHVMRLAFSFQAAFVQTYRHEESKSEDKGTGDGEMERERSMREQYLIHEQEMIHQDAGANWRENNPGDAVILSQLLSRLLRVKKFTPLSLSVLWSDGRVQTLTDPQEINNYAMADVLTGERDGQITFVADEATLTLHFVNDIWPDRQNEAVIHLKKEHATREALYYRISLMLMPWSQNDSIHQGDAENKSYSVSLLAARDLRTEKQHVDEFRYVWAEMLSKREKGEEDQMTDDEKVIARCTEDVTAMNIYRGRELYLQGRAYEALPYLRRAYDKLCSKYASLKNDGTYTFLETCYLMGSCYCQLQLYEQAYYYLEWTLPMHNVGYTSQYVNCMVNGHDLRAVGQIDGLLQMVLGDQKKSDLSEGLQGFVNFLLRRKASALINAQRYDEAEVILKRMLDEPENTDYAIDQLAYLQKIKD